MDATASGGVVSPMARAGSMLAAAMAQNVTAAITSASTAAIDDPYVTSSVMSPGVATSNDSISGGGDDDQPSISMDNLYPALVQCFAIIICGYLAGRLNIITNTEAKGLNTFVGTFALPSVIFLSLAELNWSTVNWNFLLSILISKTIVFLAVAIISLLVARPVNYGRAGILAIFCTQSNDFAIGFPIVTALYSKLHPEYASYIYLLAPISLAVLNPIGYVLMEISKIRAKATEETQIRIGSANVMAHRTQIKICKDTSWQRPNVLINLGGAESVSNEEQGASTVQQNESRDKPKELPRGSKKRKHPVSEDEATEPRRSKRERKTNKSDDYFYS